MLTDPALLILTMWFAVCCQPDQALLRCFWRQQERDDDALLQSGCSCHPMTP